MGVLRHGGNREPRSRIALIGTILVISVGVLWAKSSFLNEFLIEYPTTTLNQYTEASTPNTDRCLVCHVPSSRGTKGNAYLLDLLNLKEAGGSASDFLALNNVDSDGDGVDNGIEAITPRVDDPMTVNGVPQVGYNMGLIDCPDGTLGYDPQTMQVITNVHETPPAGIVWNAEDPNVNCSDDLDNDCDGLKDLDDPDCTQAECVFDSDCDNGLWCDGIERCTGGVCETGTPIDCSDGLACTADACNEQQDRCDSTPDNAQCDNGLWCDGIEICNVVQGCQPGTSVDCDDGVGCTLDTCDESTNSCDNTPDDTACDNGLFCDGPETCDPVLDCRSGTPESCDDGVGCTVDNCDAGTDSCGHVVDHAACDNGMFCDGAETCDATADCQPGSDPCPGSFCDEGVDVCTDCQTDIDCSDGIFCNGVEMCVAGSCQAGTPVSCDDGVGCTVDNCDESTDTCGHVADDTACDNGMFCDGAEICDAVADCQSVGEPCPGQACDEAIDVCTECQTDADCADDAFCNGVETCVAGSCQAGTPVSCDDGVGCTVDSCDEIGDECVYTPDNGQCDDGMWCNGTEICDPGADCVTGASPCASGQVCHEDTDTCDTGGVGQGFVLSRNADFSTDDREFLRNEILYMLVWTDQVDYNDTNKTDWDIRDSGNGRAGGKLTNHLNYTYTTSYDLSQLPGDAVAWSWNVKINDHNQGEYLPSATFSVLPAPDCTVDSDCDDGDICTDDSCNEETDTCDHVYDEANDASCLMSGCGNGLLEAHEQCDDGNVVNGDCCSRTCKLEAAGSDCDDGMWCTTGDVCDATGTCTSGAPRTCDDQVGCTLDECDEDANQCVNLPDVQACDDGDICTTDECDPESDCTYSLDPTNAPECEQCTDGDQDGYSGTAIECGPWDCDDTDSLVHPGATEICGDQTDNDCDGETDILVCDLFDVTGEGAVNGKDLAWMGRAFGLCSANPVDEWWYAIDLNRDGCVDGVDLALISQAWTCRSGQNICE